MPPHHHGPTRAWQIQAVLWYLLFFSSQVAVQPFLGAWFASQGLTAQELGLINALRPWISLPASFLWTALADQLLMHRSVMLGCFVLSAITRTALLQAHTFASILALVLATQILASPVGILADSAIVAACRDNEYGTYRKWGAVGWGVVSLVAGVVIDKWGMKAAFLLHLVLSVPCLRLGASLHEHQSAQLRLAKASATAAANLRSAARRYKRVNTLEPVKEEDESDYDEEAGEGAGAGGGMSSQGAANGLGSGGGGAGGMGSSSEISSSTDSSSGGEEQEEKGGPFGVASRLSGAAVMVPAVQQVQQLVVRLSGASTPTSQLSQELAVRVSSGTPTSQHSQQLAVRSSVDTPTGQQTIQQQQQQYQPPPASNHEDAAAPASAATVAVAAAAAAAGEVGTVITMPTSAHDAHAGAAGHSHVVVGPEGMHLEPGPAPVLQPPVAAMTENGLETASGHMDHVILVPEAGDGVAEDGGGRNGGLLKQLRLPGRGQPQQHQLPQQQRRQRGRGRGALLSSHTPSQGQAAQGIQGQVEGQGPQGQIQGHVVHGQGQQGHGQMQASGFLLAEPGGLTQGVAHEEAAAQGQSVGQAALPFALPSPQGPGITGGLQHRQQPRAHRNKRHTIPAANGGGAGGSSSSSGDGDGSFSKGRRRGGGVAGGAGGSGGGGGTSRQGRQRGGGGGGGGSDTGGGGAAQGSQGRSGQVVGTGTSALQGTFLQKLQALLSDRQVVVFLCMTTLLGFGYGTIETFLFVFLQQLGATDTLMGLTLTITCAAEVPVFQIQPWLLGRFGVDRLLDVVVVTYAVRMLAYASLPSWGSVWAVLPVEILHGVTFGLGWGVGTTNCKRLAPAGLAATMQGMFQGCYFGLGYGLGSLLGGFISQRHGFPIMYTTGAACMIVGWAFLGLGRLWADDSGAELLQALRARVASWGAWAGITSAGAQPHLALARAGPGGVQYKRLDTCQA